MLTTPLFALVLATYIAVESLPVVLPAPSQAPLREITRVRVTTPLCVALASDATTAIDTETIFNVRLIDAEIALERTDFDSNPIAKARATSDVRARYVELAATIARSRRAMRSFDKRLQDAPTSQSRELLQSFANALDGALHKQQSLADELGRFLAYIDTHDAIDASTHDDLLASSVASANNGRDVHGPFDPRDFGPGAGVPQQLSTIAKAASTTLAKRAEPIAADEREAASRIDAAFAGC